MSWWNLLFRTHPVLMPGQRARVDNYVGLAQPDLRHAIRSMRFVVVDVETTGLLLYRDDLIAIGAIPVERTLISLADSFEVVLRQAKPSSNGNILLHGIDGTTQTTGRNPVEALIDFLDYVGKDVLVGFHASFDRIMITRATKKALGIELENRWLDLAVLAPELLPEHARRASTLDDWTERLGIDNPARHNALADALVTAQLLQVTLAAAQGQRLVSGEDLLDTERAGRWLEGRR